jgi:hypothetical protein
MTTDEAARITQPYNATAMFRSSRRAKLLSNFHTAVEELRGNYQYAETAKEDMKCLDKIAAIITKAATELSVAMRDTDDVRNAPAPSDLSALILEAIDGSFTIEGYCYVAAVVALDEVG